MADNERVITTRFEADISNFSSSAQQLNRYIKTVDKEFKNTTATMGKWADNTDGLRAKITQLTKTLDAQEKQLKALEDEYNSLTEEEKKSKDGQEKFIKVLDQRTKIEKTKSSINHYSKSLKELEDAGVKTKDELNKLNKENEEMKRNAQDLSGKILKGMAVGLAGIATACVGAIKGLSSIVENTKELRTQMGQLETTFQQQGLSVSNAEKTYNTLFGVLGDSGKATEASMHLGQLAKSEKELEDYTNILTGIYATFGDSLPVEGLAEAMNHTANLGSVQGNLADALEWSGINVDDFNEQLATLSTEEERAQLINDTLNGIYGETAEKYKEVNGEVIKANETQNAYNQAMASIGEKVQPAITAFKLSMVEVLQTILEKFNEVDIDGLIGNISNAITSLVNVVLPPLMSAVSWILDNLNWLVPVMGSVIGLIAGISAGIKIYNSVVAIAKAVQLAWNLAMSMNPIGIVITAIGALVTAFVVLWNKCEGFRNFFIGLWDSIKKGAVAGINGIIAGFETGLNAIINFVNALTGGLSSLWEWADIPAIPKIPNVSIPRLAKGGIVDNPTLAVVGEAGKEAIMPLENNTAWIDKLASKLSEMSNNQQVVQATPITNNTFNYTFEKMETSRIALHKAVLETKRAIGG